MNNILITAISRYGKESEYAFETGVVYTGKISCEPGVKEACDYFHNKGEHLNVAILITTDQVNEPDKNNEGQPTPTQYIEDLIHKLEPSCKIVPILFDNHSSEKLIVEILKQKFKPHDQIICDISGGLRAGMISMLLLMYFLRYEGIEIVQILSAEHQEDNEIILKNHTEFNEMIDMINALNSFTSQGDSRQLEKILTDQCEKDWTALTRAIHTFSDNIIQANPDKISDNLNQISYILNQSEDTGTKESFTDEMITAGGIPAIRSKLKLDDNHDVIATIYWCLENNMMLQALSIYNEQVPVYLIRQKKIIVPDEDILKKLNKQKGKNPYEVLLYNTIGNFWKTIVNNASQDLFPSHQIGTDNFKRYRVNVPDYDQVIAKVSEYQEKYDLNDDVCLRMTAHLIFLLNLITEKHRFGAVAAHSINLVEKDGDWKDFNHLRAGGFIQDSDWKSEQLDLGDNLYHQFAETMHIHFEKPDGFTTVLDDYLAIRFIRNLSIHTGEETITEKIRQRYGDLLELNLDRNIAFVRKALKHLSDYVNQ